MTCNSGANASELLENLEGFHVTTWAVMLSAGLNLQPHPGMLHLKYKLEKSSHMISDGHIWFVA